MKQINNYILEKLHLDKNIKTDSIFKSPDEISEAFNIKSAGAKDIIRRWMVDNKIFEVVIDFEGIMDLIEDEYKTEKMIYDPDKVKEYIKLIDDKDIRYNWKSADAKEIKSNKKYDDFLIFSDTYINADFVLIKNS